MSYIRTKNRIYETEGTFLDNNGKWKYYNILEDDMAIILRSQIIKQSDTIEELCDRYVVIDKETKEVVNIVTFLAYAKLWSSCKYDIYGAVWTDKGLIYVAKMNDKGDLELI